MKNGSAYAEPFSIYVGFRALWAGNPTYELKN